MLKKLEKLNSRGFTIIEVMIVLAIAGLIILIVLLAVPALQRNGRNTAIKNDASAVAGGITDFQSNNNGASPTQGTFVNGVYRIQNATILNGGDVKLQPNTNVMQLNAGGPTAFAVRTAPAAGAVAAGNIYIDAGESCQSQGNAPVRSNRAFAIYYWTEVPGTTAGADATTGIINGAGLKGQCIDT